MPGFDWSRVPAPLAADLARDLALDVGPRPGRAGSLAALKSTFGSEPGPDFVRVAWPVLRDRWLGTDAEARADVVSRLRAAGLGDHELPPRGADAQLRYLRSCRNTGRLRTTVLERFLELGERQATRQRVVSAPSATVPRQARPSRRTQDPPAAPATHDDPATVDLRAKVEAAWDELTAALGLALAGLPLGAQLTLTLDPTAGGTGDATYTVEFMVPDEDRLHAEAVGNAALPPGHRLDRHAIADLIALGWSPPGVVEGTTDSFGLEVPVAAAPRLAAVTARTLREVYGTPHPAFLTYSATALEDEPELPPLGAARRVPGGPVPADTGRDDPAAPLDERVRLVVSELLSRPVDELPVDADGDIAIRSGSAMVFVRISDDPPLVEVSSPVLTEVTATQRLYERLSALTKTMPIGRLYLEDGTVWASVGVFGTDFQPTHLHTAIRVMTGLADVLDDRLQGDFGGKIFFGDALPARREPGTGEKTGMYL